MLPPAGRLQPRTGGDVYKRQEENPEAVKAHGVEGYPTMILFEGGAEKARLKGLQQKPLIVSTIAG